jgi:hypothetical protein
MTELTCSLKCPVRAEKIAVYMLNLIASITGLRFRRVDGQADINYGEVCESESLVIPHRKIDEELGLSDPDSWNLLESGDFKIVLPGYIKSESALRQVNVHNGKIVFDLFLLMFNFLKTALSFHNRVPEFFQRFKTGNGCIFPIFEGYIEYFLQILKYCHKIPLDFQRKSPWPGGAVFALGISHDIDIFKRKFPGSVAMLMKSIFSDEIPGGVKGSLTGLFESVSTTLTGKTNPYSLIEKWFDIESEKTFFIHAGERWSPKDPTYDPQDVKRTLDRFNKDCFEVGLHNSIGTWVDKQKLKKQRDMLSDIFDRDIEGIRPHYLDCKYPDFWRNAEEFKYSSSVGSDTIPGFTCGINIPFFGFDFDTGDVLDILELPIGLMDCALFTANEKTVRERMIDELIDACISTHGLLVLDWHTRTAYEPDFPGWFETYCLILKKARSAGAFIAPLSKINNYWKSHCTSFFLS